jgi:hypothetical protein
MDFQTAGAEFDGPSLLEAIKAHPDASHLGFVKFVS